MAEPMEYHEPKPVFENSNWGITNVVVKSFSYRWTFPYFMSLPKMTGEACAIDIPTNGESYINWKLRVYPNGKNMEYKDYVSVLLFALYPYDDDLDNPEFQLDPRVVHTQITVEMLDSSNNVLVSKSERMIFGYDTENGFPDLIKIDTLQRALEKSIDGTLTILCIVKEFTGIKSESSAPSGQPMKKPEDTHSTKVLKAALTDPVYSDYTINVNGRKFKAHKVILHHSSPYFARILSNTVAERERHEVTLVDVEPDIFEKVLEFMYLGSVETIKDHAMELMPVANMFELKGLFEQCEDVLCSQITMESAVKLLVFSGTMSTIYPAEHLKNASVKYIQANVNGFCQTADWKTYVENDPKLLNLILKG